MTLQTFGTLLVAALAGLFAFAPSPAGAVTCADPASALGVERIIEIDTSSGPLYGDISVLQREDNFLAPREVVLTFDDGPMPWITKSILDTLDRYCTKATFFSVGRMAIAYPATIKDVLARGHTLGGHTWSHPLNLKHRPLARAVEEIERGFSAIALAAGQPITPFFRFPGLSDNDAMLAYLQERGIAAFTVDVVSNDSYIGSPQRLAAYTLDQIDRRQGGIVLFHDIKSATAKALPDILAGLKARGYKIVHMRSKAPLKAIDTYDAELAAQLAKRQPAKPEAVPTAASAAGSAEPPHLVPFFGDPGVLKTLSGADAEVTALAPPARPRRAATVEAPPASDEKEAPRRAAKVQRVRASAKSKAKHADAEPSPFNTYGF